MTDCIDCDEDKKDRITEENKKKENYKKNNSWFSKRKTTKSNAIDEIKLEKNLLMKKKEKRTSIVHF